MTHTVSTLEISERSFKEIADKLRAAGYGHLFMADGSIDMYGIGLARGVALAPSDAAEAAQSDRAHTLVQRHANATRALEHMYTEKNIERLKAVGAELEAALAAPVAPAAQNPWQDLYASAMATLAPAFDYIQAHADQFGATAGDCKMAIIAETFPKLAAADAARLVAPAAVAPSPRKELAKSVFGGINALRWLLNITTEFDRKDVRTRQAARLLDEYGDKNGRMNRVHLEHLWKVLNDELSLDDTLECLSARDAAPTPTVAADAAAPHSDDLAVDALAAAMKEKLAQARAKGRSGWQECDPEDLSHMLREHVSKGDPRDVANFCAFLWNLKQPIAKAKLLAANEHDAQPIGDRLTLAAINALRSYEYGNSSPDLAKSVADRLGEARAGVGP
ncbi:hypothetical protein [Paraburkholderia nodosa]|uniref:hypothetical protein n=1 Tax=Paraburkholderia nodosa TaxID=392320 RepID=UPI000841CF53|nr:hypothetical protein [Paraburkholderia nodosa]